MIVRSPRCSKRVESFATASDRSKLSPTVPGLETDGRSPTRSDGSFRDGSLNPRHHFLEDGFQTGGGLKSQQPLGFFGGWNAAAHVVGKGIIGGPAEGGFRTVDHSPY